MAEAATPTGVVSDRMEMLAEIERKSQERTADELKESGFDPANMLGADETLPEDRPESIPADEWAGMSDEAKGAARAAEPGDAEPAKDTPAAAPTADAPAAVVEPPKDPAKVHKLKVDGQEVDFTEDKILEAGKRALQKDMAADRRLEEATRLLREAQQRTEVIGSPSQDGGRVAPPSAEDARALAHAIQYGSERDLTLGWIGTRRKPRTSQPIRSSTLFSFTKTGSALMRAIVGPTSSAIRKS
jgi:hypothetical protein